MSVDGPFDVVIVGSGHAGANLAYLLAQQQRRVLIIEAGPADPTTRQDYIENFYLNTFKSPSSPYPPNDNARDPSRTNAPRPTMQDLAEGWNDPAKSYLTYEEGSLAFGSSYERVAGGTGNHWTGTCLRMASSDFRLNTLYNRGRDWPIAADDLAHDYGIAEHLVGVSASVETQKRVGTYFPDGYQYPMREIPKTVCDQVFSAIEGAPLTDEPYADGETIVTATPAGRNSEPYQNRRVCHGNTNCTPICPIQARYDTTVTLSLALDTGYVSIIYKSVVDYISIDTRTGRINGVHYIPYDDISVPGKRPDDLSGLMATGTFYVLAANAIENAKILLNSEVKTGRPIANTSDQVGRNLMDHPIYLAWGLLPSEKRAYGYRGPVSTSGVESLRDGAFRKNRAAWRIEIGNEGWNWPANDPYTTAMDFIYGSNDGQLNPDGKKIGNKSFVRTLNDYLTRQFRMAFLVEQDADPNNRVMLSKDHTDNLGIPRPLISYNISDYTKAGFQQAAAATKEIMTRLGAKDYTRSVKSPGTTFNYNGTDYDFNGAGHLCGTHVMGVDRSTSVVDSYQKSWDHDNLYVVGCGSMPSVGTQNPTLTLLALAARTSRDILQRL